MDGRGVAEAEGGGARLYVAVKGGEVWVFGDKGDVERLAAALRVPGAEVKKASFGWCG